MTFNNLQSQFSSWCQTNFGQPVAPRKARMMLINSCQEVATLVHSMEDHDLDIRDVVGDLIIFFADAATRRGVNLDNIVTQALNRETSRDFIKFPLNGETA